MKSKKKVIILQSAKIWPKTEDAQSDETDSDSQQIIK